MRNVKEQCEGLLARASVLCAGRHSGHERLENTTCYEVSRPGVAPGALWKSRCGRDGVGGTP